ncbi:hypothetical protein Rhal01_03796 [Rubritalea halochordaticola]|uniref:Sialate O-acetylesterase n=1 Tax=Rubritalea halochordaticola TaxID=714537 RepID=A0ABP9V6I0_9BACT
MCRFLTRLLILLVCLPSQLQAELSLASVFSDKMLFQREQAVPIWGTATPGAAIQVGFAGQQLTTTASAEGKWSLSLKAMPASSRDQQLTVTSGTKQLVIKDVLIGDLWIATGQSNMDWQLNQTTTGKSSIADSEDRQLRLLNLEGTLHPNNKHYELKFLKQLNKDNYYRNKGWQQSGPQSSANFSAVAYHFAKSLRSEVKVPVGVINLAVGGSPIEAHLSPEVMQKSPELSRLLPQWWKNEDYPQWCRQRAALNLSQWTASADLRDQAPPHPFAPHFLWEAGIAKILPLPVKGILWYQGESNATQDGAGGPPVDPALNKMKFKSLVKSWRQAWKDDSLPVYFVQLPGLNRPWALFREMQLEASQEIPHAHMAVSIDLGHPTDVHPRNKQPVGERLARLALKHSYGKDIIANGPIYKRSTFKQDKVYVDFENSKGLSASGGGAIKGFELAGNDRVFHPAEATPSKGYLLVRSVKVKEPAFIRYAWANDPECNLVNAAGLPASPFRARSDTATVRIACIGDSITFGSGTKDRLQNSYPLQLQDLLGKNYEVKNFGNPGRGVVRKSMRGKEKRAYFFMKEHQQALAYQPDIVICNLGINDLMDWNRFGKDHFVSDYRSLLQSYKALDTRPRIIIWQPLAPLFKGQTYYGNPAAEGINQAIKKVSDLENVESLDMASPFEGKDHLFPDKLHPNAEGAKIIAEITAKYLN